MTQRKSKHAQVAAALSAIIRLTLELRPDVRRMGIALADITLSPYVHDFAFERDGARVRAFLVTYQYRVSQALPRGWHILRIEADAVIVSRGLT